MPAIPARRVGWLALVALGVGAGFLAGRRQAAPSRSADSGVCPQAETCEPPPRTARPETPSIQSAAIPPRRPAAVRSAPVRAAVSEPIPGRPAQGETGIPVPRIRKGTLLDLLGLETGDQLLRINHLDVRSPEQAWQAYALLRHADHLVVEVRRGDRIIEFVYRII
jgi:hypothetical protein